MALPSASRHSTGRSGQATAAPVASGRPWPIAPPVRHSQSWGGAPAVAPDRRAQRCSPSSLTTAPSGSRAPMAAARLCGSSAPVGRSGPATRLRPSGRSEVLRAPPPASPGHPGASSDPVGEDVHLAPLGHQVAGQVGVGEERHRGEGVGQHQVPGPLELGDGELGQIAEPLDGGDPRTALDDGPGTSRTGAWPPWPGRPGRPPSGPASGPRSLPPGAPRAPPSAGLWPLRPRRLSATVSSTAPGWPEVGSPRLLPRHVGGNDQRGHAPGRSEGTLDGGDGVRGESAPGSPTNGTTATRAGPGSRCPR